MKKIIHILALCSIFAGSFNLHAEHRMAWGFSERQGKRTSMEDAYTHGTLQLGQDKAEFFGLFDGHGGKGASNYASLEAVGAFARAFPKTSRYTNHTIQRAFEQAYRLLNDEIQNNFSHDGTAALTAVLVGNMVHIAWAGDSRAIVLGSDGYVIAETDDHKPDSINELDRIGDPKRVNYLKLVTDGTSQYRFNHHHGERMSLPEGFSVCQYGPARLGTLSLSRSLGDARAKQFEPLIIADPEVLSVSVRSGDIVVLACDGLWDVMSTCQVADFINQYVNDHDLVLLYPECQPSGETFALEDGNDERLKLLARALRDEAFKRGSTDNISVMVLKLR